SAERIRSISRIANCKQAHLPPRCVAAPIGKAYSRTAAGKQERTYRTSRYTAHDHDLTYLSGSSEIEIVTSAAARRSAKAWLAQLSLRWKQRSNMSAS